MFRNIITQTPFNSEVENDYFSNITANNTFQEDTTFIATLRALVAPRIKEGESVKLGFSGSSYSAGYWGDKPEAVLGKIVDGYTYIHDKTVGFIQIHNFYNPGRENNDFYLDIVEKNFESYWSGWHRIVKVTEFYRKTFRVLCFINPEKKNVYIFTENMSVPKMHYLQCSIFAFLPWYFDPKEGVTEMEMKLIESLREKTSDKYMACLAELASKYNFKEERVRKLLKGFTLRQEREQAKKARDAIENLVRSINDYNRRIADALKLKSDCEIRLLGLEAKIESGESDDSEIMEYFLCNKNLILQRVNDSTMEFICTSYLTYFDEEMAKKIIDNRQSYIYRPNNRACNNYIPEEDMKRLMYALFVDGTIRIKVCAAYRFDLRGNVEGVPRYNYGYECRDYLPNPHIHHYACMGNYTRAINVLLIDHNYIGAIEQCMASCRSLNFSDSTVMKAFVSEIYGLPDYGEPPRCIELPNGSTATPLEAIKWLKEQESGTSNGENADIQGQEGEVTTDE